MKISLKRCVAAVIDFILMFGLFFAFTSIAFLLGILLIYNVFVINSLSNNLNSTSKLNIASVKIEVSEENNLNDYQQNKNVCYVENEYFN